MIDRQTLISEYGAAVRTGEAALFVGAGLSLDSRYPNWRNLLGGCIDHFNFDEKESDHLDLVAVAQYYANQADGRAGRAGLRAEVERVFEANRDPKLARNHEILGNLPISTVWTTNYDSLLERAFVAAGKRVRTHTRDLHIAEDRPSWRDVTVYKMHGHVGDNMRLEDPDGFVIAKGDYESYALRHPAFQKRLESDLLEKTFLFLGYSFSDPNVEYMLGHLRCLLKSHTRSHYTIMKRDGTRLQQLRVQDLSVRYRIHTCFVDQWTELTDILQEIERRARRRTVLFSVPAPASGRTPDPVSVQLCRDLAYDLRHRGCDILYRRLTGLAQEVITASSMSRSDSSGEKPGRTMYAQDLTDPAQRPGIAIFIADASRPRTRDAAMMDDFSAAESLGAVCIPVGATGGAAKAIWTKVAADFGAHSAGMPRALFDTLNQKRTAEEHLATVLEIVRTVAG